MTMSFARLTMLVGCLFALIEGIGRGEVAQGEDWPTFRHDTRRSGVSSEKIAPTALHFSWRWQSAHPPQVAWSGPAKWDAYANIRGLSNMRDYDHGFPAVAVGDQIYFASSADDSVYSLSAVDGTVRWVHTVDAPVRMPPCVNEGRLYFGSDGGQVYCLKAADGSLIWTHTAPDRTPLILNNGRLISRRPCRTGVLVENGTAYFGYALLPWEDATLCAVEAATGQVIGEGRFETNIGHETLEGPLAASEQFVAACRGRVAPRLFDRRTGQPVAILGEGKGTGAGGSSLAVINNSRFLHGPGNKTGWVILCDPNRPKEAVKLKGYRRAVPLPGQLLLCGHQGLALIDQETRKPIWSDRALPTQDAIVVNNGVFATGDGYVRFCSRDQGEELWHTKIDGRGVALAVAQGRLFVSTESGSIVCFSTHAEEHRDPPENKTRQAETTPDSTGQDSASGGNQPIISTTKPAAHAPSSSSIPKPGPPEKGLISRWTMELGMAERAKRRGLPEPERYVPDWTGANNARVIGPVALREAGGLQALELDGRETSVLISDDPAQMKLPVKEMSVAAWVRVDKPRTWGGIAGFIQDNGKYERGWLLGYRNDHFSFALKANDGSGRLTYLKAINSFRKQTWHHVVGTYDGKTMTIWVDGKPMGQSETQSGPIDYPPSGVFVMGTYQDQDERFPMQGQLHEVSLYSRALSPEEIQRQFQRKRSRFPQPIRLAIGPWLQFTEPDEAQLSWETDKPMSSVVSVTFGDQQQTFSQPALTRTHSVRITNLPYHRVGTYRIQVKQGDQIGLTQPFEIDTHFNDTPRRPAVPSENATPAHDADRRDHPEQFPRQALAADLLRAANMERGLCLVIGLEDGSLCEEIVRQSRMRVIAVEQDRSRIEQIRRRWRARGLYGVRAAILPVEDLTDIPAVEHFANLIFSEPQILSGNRPLTPQTVTAFLIPRWGRFLQRQREQSPLAETWKQSPFIAELAPGAKFSWNVIAQQSNSETGTWTHQYGLPDNAAYAGETLGGASSTGELNVRWIGRPGPRMQPDRNGRKPSPLAAGGRLYIQGLHRIAAVDAANGTVLWRWELPGLERFNIPRDCGNWCCDEQHLYLAIRGHAWKIDGPSGRIEAQFPVIGPKNPSPVADSSAVAEPQDWDWGYIARAGKHLLGSAVKAGTAYTNFWGDAASGWYDTRSGPATFKVCSDQLFACDPEKGTASWTYEQGVILNPTITVSGDRIYFVRCDHPRVKTAASRRVGLPELWQQQFLTALDLDTGRLVWEQPLDTVEGIAIFYLAADQANSRLVLTASNNKQYDVYGFETGHGQQVWHQQFDWPEGKGDHGRAMSRPAIVEGKVYVRPRIIDLAEGTLLPETMPLGGCGTYAATKHALIFRQSSISLWSPYRNEITKWERLRPGCWLSTIPAAGMVLSPEAGGGCSCGHWLEASIGFAPTDVSQP